MPTRLTSRRRLKKYSIGDMRERITIHTRILTAPDFDSVDLSEQYDIGTETWATIETLDKKRQLFGGVNIPEGATHSFIIRYNADITSENVIRWEGNAYDILRVADFDGRKMYLELFSKLLGDETLEANQ